MERYKLEIVNDNGDRYIRCEPATDGSWVMFKDVAELQNRGCARDQTTTQYCAEVIERDKRIAELEAALSAAAEDIGTWGSQASQYSQEKWDLEGDVKRYIAIAEGKLPYRARHPMETWKDE